MPAPPPKLPPVVLAVDIGGTKFAAGLVSIARRAARPRRRARRPERRPGGPLQGARRHRRAAARRGRPPRRPRGRASASARPARSPATARRCRRSTSRPGGSSRCAPGSSELTGARVYGDLDAKALALAEGWQGAAKGLDNYCVLTVSTGIGGGIVLDGELLDGASAQRRPRRPHHRRAQRPALRLRRPRLPRGRGVGPGDRGDHRPLADRADLRDHAAHRAARRARRGVAVQRCSTSTSSSSAAASRSGSRRRSSTPPRRSSSTRTPPAVSRQRPHHARPGSATAAR